MNDKYLNENDFAHIRAMLREAAEAGTDYAAPLIKKLDDIEDYLIKKDCLAEEMISRKEDLRQTADELADLLQQIITGAIRNEGTGEWAAEYVARARSHIRYLIDLIVECEEEVKERLPETQ